MSELLHQRERWADQEAAHLVKVADTLEACAKDWAERASYAEALKCAIRAEVYREVARSLIQPRLVREEREARDALTSNSGTKDNG